ncbi:unnamed protein product [Kuraishia capsulata CBS 1993]|uniref:Uncharacterized protein n=1 Tax=Kuraishia capsulata CBS 1993 TaxID=1382522 RepID=W6MTI0_9ASCO|nr:uncharacterized protein KUCA_T00001032001 [Kuraishia capsulata CBS 1993]CDK25065.1 unnamed protein product [Kuraishia capsulata CBS 1993]
MSENPFEPSETTPLIEESPEAPFVGEHPVNYTSLAGRNSVTEEVLEYYSDDREDQPQEVEREPGPSQTQEVTQEAPQEELRAPQETPQVTTHLRYRRPRTNSQFRYRRPRIPPQSIGIRPVTSVSPLRDPSDASPIIKFNEYKLNPTSSKRYNTNQCQIMIWQNGKSWLYSEKKGCIVGLMDSNGQLFHRVFLGMFPNELNSKMAQGDWHFVMQNEWVKELSSRKIHKPRQRMVHVKGAIKARDIFRIGRPTS